MNQAEQLPDAQSIPLTGISPWSRPSFGFGVHRCMGNRLAEMQLRILWEEIMLRFQAVEVVAQPERIRSNFVRGYKTLPVRLHRL